MLDPSNGGQTTQGESLVPWCLHFLKHNESLPDVLLLAVELQKRREKILKLNPHQIQFGFSNYFSGRVNKVLDVIAALNVTLTQPISKAHIAMALLRIVFRNYRQFNEGDPNLQMASFDGKKLAAFIVLTLLDEPTTQDRRQIAELVKQHYQSQMDAVLASVKTQIKAGRADGTATGENRALNLALEFGLMDYYKTCLDG